MESNSIHKAEHIDEQRLLLQWRGDFLDMKREREFSLYDFDK